MAENTSRTRHAGLLIPDPRIVLWEAQCSGTQAGPRAGVPEPEQVSAMALGATGDQTVDTEIEVMTRRSGYPIRAPVTDADSSQIIDRGAQFVWRNVGDADTAWRGWDPPTMVLDWHAAIWTDASGAVKYARYPVIVAADNGSLLVIAQVRETSASGGEYRLECIRRSASSSTWSRVLIEGEASAPAQDYCPAVVKLPSGRILVYRWRRQSTGSAVNAVRLWYSDDAGLTWSFGGDGVVGAGTDDTITQTRAAYKDEQVLMLAVTTDDVVRQYASSDMGLTFEHIGTTSTATTKSIDVCASESGFIVVRGVGLAFTTDPPSHRVANAFEMFTAQTAVDITTTGDCYGEANVAVVTDDSGVTWAHYVDIDNALRASMSADDGLTWCDMSGAKNTTLDMSTGFKALSACWWRGQVVLAHNWNANPGNEDDSLGIAYLGGYTNAPFPRQRAATAMAFTATWTTIWLPFDLPGDCGWTAAGTAATEALETPGLLRLNTTAANTRSYYQDYTGSIAQGLTVIIDLAAVSGGATTTNQRAVRITNSNGTSQYVLDIRIGTAGWRLYDNTATTIIGSEQSTSMLLRTQIKVCTLGSGVATWYRVVDTTIGGTQTWIAGPSSTTVTNGGGGGPASPRVMFGHLATGGAAAETVWYGVHVSAGDDVGANWPTGITNPTDLLGRLYAWRDAGVYAARGVSVQARRGPTLLGEAWTIATAYDYGRDKLMDPRPRRGWRSTDLVDDQVIAFKWSAIDTPMDSGFIGIYIAEKNLGRVTVDWYDEGTTSWVNAATYDLHYDVALTRQGESVVPNSTSNVFGYVARDEFAGASLEIDDLARRVAHHPDGRWSTSGVGIVLHLDDVDDSESTSYNAARLVPRQALLILPISATYSGVRLTQAAPDTDNPTVYQGYWEAGRILIGPVYPFADDPSWGWSVTHASGTEIADARDRSRSTRRAAPVRRTIELQWTDGIDTTPTWGNDPDYRELHDSRAAIGGTPRAIAGLMRALDGGATQVVYIPRIAAETAQVKHLRDEAILCRMVGDVSVENVHGDEQVDEVVRTGSVVLEEDV